EEQVFRLLESRGLGEGARRAANAVPLHGTLTAMAVERRAVVTSVDIGTDPRAHARAAEAIAGEGYPGFVSVPLLIGDEVLGAMNLVFSQPRDISETDKRTLLSIGRAIGLALNNARHVERIEAEIQERRRTEQALHESNDRFRRMAENILDGLTVLEEGRVVYVNRRACEICGYPEDEMMLRSTRDLAAPEETDRLMAAARAARHSDSARPPLEFWIVRKDGSRRFIRNRYSSPREGLAMPRRHYIITTDITEREEAERERAQLEQQLRHSQKMESIGRLAGGVAHDFNNLLTGIIGFADLGLSRLREGDPLQHDVIQIKRAAERAADLTRQLLAFSRRQPISPQVVRVNEIINRSQKLIERVIGEDVAFELEPSADLHNVRVDPGQLEQILVNLAVNARDAMPGPGTLTVETRNVSLGVDFCRVRDDMEPGDYVMIAVTDTGQGMNDETRRMAFEPFFTTKERGRGTGLGLSTVYGIVRQHQGFIEVDSTEGTGTTFMIYLPRVDEEPAPMSRRVGTGRHTGTERILVAEDDDMLRSLVQSALQRAGYQVLVASRGREALGRFDEAAGEVQLLLTDVIMPEMNGKELSDELKKRAPEIKVVYMSGHAEDIIAKHGILEPDTTLLQKPFSISKLVATVREALDD
ncbi:MAG: response regulator, partial [Deltaproteobacteria bacterium]|nr:response regulator [Deltaproteobacteria bacterium]